MANNLSSTAVAAIGAGIVAFAAIAYNAGSYRAFLSVEGLMIVIGGVIINAFLSYDKEDVLKAFASVRAMMHKPRSSQQRLHKDIMQFIAWSYIVQADDFIGLERETADKIHDPLRRYGMDLVITGYQPDRVREMMHTAAEAEFDRRCAPVTVLRNMAATAPAFGMVGTLIGMVTILNNSSADVVANIEGGLAIAMLATLYGLLAARLICLPAADKLLQKEEKDYFRNQMMAEGFGLLAEKQRPFYMQDKLNSFLDPSRHIDFDNHVHRTARRAAEAA